MTNVKLAGDVAFVEKAFRNRHFEKNVKINNIVMSEPHYAKHYAKLFEKTYYSLKELFPEAIITIALHGNDKRNIEFAKKHNINFIEIYKHKDNGLDIYDNADLHVGFRVHAHVSALKRRKYSYLFEQDGRGCDYGLTINRKISIPAYRHDMDNIFNRIRARALSIFSLPHAGVKDSLSEQMTALIKSDINTGFEKFIGLEDQISYFSDNIERQLSTLT